MESRQVKKDLMRFVRREVKEKSAEWGELRRLKKRALIKKGLPNIPELVVYTDSGLSFIVLIVWKKELRVYLFDKDGKMVQGQSYYENVEDIYKDFLKKSKKVAQFPPSEKNITAAQKNYYLDKQFRQIWNQLAKLLGISKKYRQNRPVIRRTENKFNGIFGTKLERDHIFVPSHSTKLILIFTFYSLFFFLPYSIRHNETIAEAIAFRLLKSFKKFRNESVPKYLNSSTVFLHLEHWKELNPRKVLSNLHRISLYYDDVWATSDFLAFLEFSSNLMENYSRQKLPHIFCQLFTKSHNIKFLILSTVLGLPFDVECPVPDSLIEKKAIILYEWLKRFQFSKLVSVMGNKDNFESKGQFKAFKEAMNYQFTKVLQIELNSTVREIIEITNRSDLPIIISEAILVLPDSTEEILDPCEIFLRGGGTKSIDLRDLTEAPQYPIRFRYRIFHSVDRIEKPIFTGTLVV